MNFRLKTSRATADRLKQLQTTTGFTPNILSRIAVALSLREKQPVSKVVKDVSGIEFNRNTLTGSYDYVFKALITQHEQRHITDDEYFPDLFNAHLERGIRLLINEYDYAGNHEKLITNLVGKMREA